MVSQPREPTEIFRAMLLPSTGGGEDLTKLGSRQNVKTQLEELGIRRRALRYFV